MTASLVVWLTCLKDGMPSRGPGLAWEVGPFEPQEVQQRHIHNPAPGSGQPIINTDWGMKGLGASLPRKRYWWIRGWTWANTVCFQSRVKNILGCFKSSMTSKSREGILLPWSALMRSHLEHCIQLWGPPHRKKIDLMEQIQRMVTKTIQGLKHFSYKERLRELGLLSLEKRWLKEDLNEVSQYQKRT